MSRGIAAQELRTPGTGGLSQGELIHPTGRYSVGMAANTGQQQFITANFDRLWASQFVVSESFRIDRVTIFVNAAIASSNTRFGIYESGADGLPGALVVDAGSVDTSTTGEKAQTVTETLYGPRIYWGAFVMDSASIGIYARSVSYSLGDTIVFNQSDEVVFKAHTFAALPDPFGAIADYIALPGQSIHVRAA